MRRKVQRMSKLMHALRHSERSGGQTQATPATPAPRRVFAAERRPEIDRNRPGPMMAGASANSLPLQATLAHVLAGPAVQPTATAAAAFPVGAPVGTHHHYPTATHSFTPHPTPVGVPMPGIGNVYQAIQLSQNLGSFHGWVMSGASGPVTLGGMAAVMQRLNMLAHH